MALYRDINLDFEKHPLTGDLLTATDTEAIRKSLKNLVLLNFNEAPFEPEKGTNLKASLFENFSPMTVEFLKVRIEEMIEKYEPRVRLISTEIFERIDNNALEVTINYEMQDLGVIDELNIFVERTR